MKVDTDTWHYRNYEVWRNDSSSGTANKARRAMEWDHTTFRVNLCLYVRIALVWGPLHRIARWGDDRHFDTLASIFSVVAVYAIGVAGGLMLQDIWGLSATWWLRYLALPPVALLMVATLVVVLVSPFWIRDRLQDRKLGQGTYQPSIITQYAKTRKRKICPLIEFESQEQS